MMRVALMRVRLEVETDKLTTTTKTTTASHILREFDLWSFPLDACRFRFVTEERLVGRWKLGVTEQQTRRLRFLPES